MRIAPGALDLKGHSYRQSALPQSEEGGNFAAASAEWDLLVGSSLTFRTGGRLTMHHRLDTAYPVITGNLVAPTARDGW